MAWRAWCGLQVKQVLRGPRTGFLFLRAPTAVTSPLRVGESHSGVAWWPPLSNTLINS